MKAQSKSSNPSKSQNQSIIRSKCGRDTLLFPLRVPSYPNLCDTGSLLEVLIKVVLHFQCFYCQAPGLVQGPGQGPVHGPGQGLTSELKIQYQILKRKDLE